VCAADGVAALTADERGVLLALASGLRGNEIAPSRHTSLLTIRTQIKSIKSKLGERSLAQSVASVMGCKHEDQRVGGRNGTTMDAMPCRVGRRPASRTINQSAHAIDVKKTN
jgi:DNA-binding CsgD family transcriptional regulator